MILTPEQASTKPAEAGAAASGAVVGADVPPVRATLPRHIGQINI
jgi:hypothetical protein